MQRNNTFETEGRAEAPAVSPRDASEPINGKVTAKYRYKAYVLTLLEFSEANSTLKRSERLGVFREKWRKAWPELDIPEFYTFYNSPKLRGYGCLAAAVQVLQNALMSPDEFDYLLLFEDDAVPFENTTWPNKPGNDLERRLEQLEQVDGTALLLGGHTFKQYDVKKTRAVAAREGGGIVRVGAAWGSYGMIFRRKYLVQYLKLFSDALKEKVTSKSGSTDTVWYGTEMGRHMYASVPLLVDHHPGYSRTWNRMRKRSWEGHREWWK